jgi:aspartyl-tRNA(Asn)/glutamyl-tRNA(Gln) amidotransferase subunit A
MDALKFIRQAREGGIDIVEHTHRFLDEAKKINEKNHFFNTICEDDAILQAKEVQKNSRGRLCGLPVSIKDCICVKGVESRAGSKILSGYEPVFDATVVSRIKKEGGIVVGKTAQDEFGFGSFSVNVGKGFEIPKNPHDPERVCGGSSGGSAGITSAIGFPHISIGQSTGGSIAAPASFCGVFGLCPTYGRVSRYGLIDYANSLDKIGPIARNAQEASEMLSVISGYDERDSTSLNEPEFRHNFPGELKIGVIKEGFSEDIDPRIRELIMKKVNASGIAYEEVSLDAPIRHGIPAYYIIAMSEASTNLAKLCGMRYGAAEPVKGSFNQYFTNVRSKYFGEEVKRRIIIGTFTRMTGYRDAYYIKALKVRSKIIAEYKRLFSSYDVLVSPTMPILPPKITEVEKLSPLQHYQMDVLTAGPNLGGFPHASMPVGRIEGLPVGLMGIADHLAESKLISLGKIMQE